MKRSKLIYPAFFLLALTLLLTVIDRRSFDRPFYKKEYEQNNTAEYMGMSQEDLDRTTDVLLGYLQDERDDIIVTAVVDGHEREVFDERETLHMIDVKNLYRNALLFRNIAGIGGVILLITALYGTENKKKILNQGFMGGVGLLFAVIAALAVWAAMDFNAFWIQFHEVFFDNDLYLLNPNTELLIRMVPEQFFYDLVMRIIIEFLGILAVTGIVLKLIPEKKEQA